MDEHQERTVGSLCRRVESMTVFSKMNVQVSLSVPTVRVADGFPWTLLILSWIFYCVLQLRSEEVAALETEASLLVQRAPHQQREIFEEASKAAQTTLDEIHNVGRLLKSTS